MQPVWWQSWVVVHATVHVPLDHMELVTHVSHSMSLMTDMAEHVRWTLRAQQPVLFCDLLCAKYIYYLSICTRSSPVDKTLLLDLRCTTKAMRVPHWVPLYQYMLYLWHNLVLIHTANLPAFGISQRV